MDDLGIPLFLETPIYPHLDSIWTATVKACENCKEAELQGLQREVQHKASVGEVWRKTAENVCWRILETCRDGDSFG